MDTLGLYLWHFRQGPLSVLWGEGRGGNQILPQKGPTKWSQQQIHWPFLAILRIWILWDIGPKIAIFVTVRPFYSSKTTSPLMFSGGGVTFSNKPVHLLGKVYKKKEFSPGMLDCNERQEWRHQERVPTSPKCDNETVPRYDTF